MFAKNFTVFYRIVSYRVRSAMSANRGARLHFTLFYTWSRQMLHIISLNLMRCNVRCKLYAGSNRFII